MVCPGSICMHYWFSSRNLPRASRCLWWPALFLRRVLATRAHAAAHAHYALEKTRNPPSIAAWSSSEDHMPVGWCVWQQTDWFTTLETYWASQIDDSCSLSDLVVPLSLVTAQFHCSYSKRCLTFEDKMFTVPAEVNTPIILSFIRYYILLLYLVLTCWFQLFPKMCRCLRKHFYTWNPLLLKWVWRLIQSWKWNGMKKEIRKQVYFQPHIIRWTINLFLT